MPSGEHNKERNEVRAAIKRELQFSNYKIDISTNCWFWLGGKDKDGYGKVKKFGKTVRASRLYYEKYKGGIEDNKVIMHLCDNPPCVNPDHLNIGTHLDNEKNKDLKGRRSPSPSISHPELLARGEKHYKSKLTEDAIYDIRESLSSASVLAIKYNVHKSIIFKIKSGKTWRHLL